MGNKNAQEILGITCPAGSAWYVCKSSLFIGCCASDPCQRTDGLCLQEDLRATSFDGTIESHTKIGTQKCVNTGNSTSFEFWSCTASNPPFLGCCTVNPCEEGTCPQENLRATLMNPQPELSKVFRDYENQDDGGLSKGAIAGIAAGGGAALIIIALGVFFFLRRKRKSQPPAVPAKNDAFMSSNGVSPYTNPPTPMTQFSPVPHSAHPSQHGGYPYSPQQPGADSPAYYFTPSQTPGSPPYYPNTNIPVPPVNPAAYGMAKSPYEQSTSPVSTHNNHYNPQMAAELPAMPDAPSQNGTVLRAASTTTYKGNNKRESASSRMTAPLPDHHHSHTHQLAELGETQITAEIGESVKKDPNSPRPI